MPQKLPSQLQGISRPDNDDCGKVADRTEALVCYGQVVRLLRWAIAEELDQLREPGDAGHLCFRTFWPLIKIREEQVLRVASRPKLVSSCLQVSAPAISGDNSEEWGKFLIASLCNNSNSPRGYLMAFAFHLEDNHALHILERVNCPIPGRK